MDASARQEDPTTITVDTAAGAAAIDRKPADIRRWRQRGLLEQVGKDDQGRGLYRLTDIITVAEAHPPRHT